MNFISQHWHISLIAGILALISLGFIFRFVVPAMRIGREHRQAISSLKQLRPAGSTGGLTDIEKVASEVMVTEKLAHCWSEFAETLHPQTAINEMGQEMVVRWRATAMAEAYFTDQALIETPLKTEFYKHLPGILTGIGIIGTFSGLILGLTDFQVSSNADEVRNSLASLIQNVGHAFYVSAAAIFMAMVVTWIEKSIVTARFREVEALCHLIDGQFDAGAGEEYLARLVTASETSATQAAQIKDSLVSDLKEILTELTRQQVEAAAHNNQQLSQTLVQTFSESLKEPISKISEAVNRVSGDQGEAVNKLLTDVLSSFTAQMQDMFGGQIRGMNDALQNTSQAILSASAKFDELAANIQSAGQGAADAMAGRLEQVINASEARQEAMNARMSEFVEEIRSAVKSSQAESAEQTQALLSDLGEKVAAVVGRLDEQSRSTSAMHEARQSELARQAQELQTQMGSEVTALTDAVKASTEQMRASIVQLAEVTRDALDRMNRGADTLSGASARFSQSVEGMGSVADKVVGTTEKLALSANALNGATQASMQVINDYRETRDTFAAIVSDLKTTVENARRDASLTSELVSRLASAAESLGAAQQQAEEYLANVTQVLEEAHEGFAKSVEQTLRKSNSAFHKELAEATNLLKGAIQDLGDTLDAVTVKR